MRMPALPARATLPARPRTRRTRAAMILALTAALALLHAGAVSSQSGGVSTDVEIAALLDEIEVSSAKQERLVREAATLTGQRDQARKQLRGQVRALYRLTRSGLAPLGGGLDAVLRHVSRVRRLERLIERQAKHLTHFDRRTRTLRAESAEAGHMLERARARLASLQSAPARSNLDSVLSADSDYRPPAGDTSGLYGLRVMEPMQHNTFEAARGRLSSPVTGEVRIVPSRRAESDGPGLEFQAAVGTPVRAVAAGRVAFSDRYGSYGRLVILDHGDGYYTVYGGLGAVEVRVGDDLSRQARIGSIGTDYTPSALFFEVRKGTRTLEPRSWLGL